MIHRRLWAVLGVFALFPPGTVAADETLDRLVEDLGFLADDATVVGESRTVFFLDTPAETGDQIGTSGSVRLEVAGPLLDSWEVAVTPEFRWSTDSEIVGNHASFLERDLTRPRFGLAEAWASYQSGPWTIKAGKQIFSWSNADLYSPADDLNARDKLDLPAPFKLGEAALSVAYNTADFGIEGVFLPWMTPDRLPGLNNPWTRSRAAIADAAQAQTGIRPVVGDGRRAIPNGTDGMQVGLRGTTSALIDGTDLAVSALRGVSRTPVFRARPVAPTLLLLDGEFPAYTELAAGFSTVISDFEFHGEAALHLTDSSARDDDYLSYVIGFRREWSDLELPLSPAKIRLTAEYAGELVTRRIDAGTPFIATGFDRTATNSFLGKLDVEFDDDTSWVMAGALNIEHGDYALDSYVEHKFNDTISLIAGVQVFAGPSNSFFGEWRDNDQLYATFKVYW